MHRKAVSPIVAPDNVANMAGLIRDRTIHVLDGLPRGETFNGVDRVSIELTALMLATLLDFPLDERRKLTWWSDVATSVPMLGGGVVNTLDERTAELQKMGQRMTLLWNERVNAPPRNDPISMLAHNPATRNMSPLEFMGNCVLLIVGGNDTTRNSMNGGLLALHEHTQEDAKLRANPGLIENMVSETIRWQTPLAHMRRATMQDTELGGKLIRKGARLVMWCLSGNRDASAIDRPDQLLIDRPRARQHLSFGFGIHRGVGNRLAELQLKILWEEVMKRFPLIEVVAPPKRVPNCFVRGYSDLLVRIPA